MTMRPSVKLFCSLISSSVQPAACSFGSTYFRHVSASFMGIGFSKSYWLTRLTSRRNPAYAAAPSFSGDGSDEFFITKLEILSRTSGKFSFK